MNDLSTVLKQQVLIVYIDTEIRFAYASESARGIKVNKVILQPGIEEERFRLQSC